MKLILFIYLFNLLKAYTMHYGVQQVVGQNVGVGGCRKTLGECVMDDMEWLGLPAWTIFFLRQNTFLSERFL